MNNKTAKKENIYAIENKLAATEAKNAAEKLAIEKMSERIQAIEEAQRIHAYLLAPYVEYSYTYKHKDENGIVSSKTRPGETLYPISNLLSEQQQLDLPHLINIFAGRLELYFSARCKDTDIEKWRTDAKIKLQNVFSMLENAEAGLHYNANLYDLETMYALSFKVGNAKSGRQLSAKKSDALLKNIVYCLWSKLVEKGYTLGMPTQTPPARPVEAKKAVENKTAGNKTAGKKAVEDKKTAEDKNS